MSRLSQVRFFQENHISSMYFLAPFIAGRSFLTSLFYEDLLPCPSIYGLLLPFQILPNPPTLIHRLQPPPLLLLLLHCFFGWMGDPAKFDVPPNAIMDLHMSNLSILVPERLCCVFYATRHQFHWGLTQKVFCWYSDLIWHIQIETHKHTQYTQGQ